jgi:hypothetical protein
VAVYGFLMALSSEARVAILPHVVPRPLLAGIIQLNSAIERITFVVGPLLASLFLWGWDVEVAFIASATGLAVTSLLLAVGSRTPITTPAVVTPHGSVDARGIGWAAVRHQPALLLLAGGLFSGAALAICLKVVLVELATGPLDRSDAILGLLLALVGIGTLLGPVSVPRLLLHIPVSVMVAGGAIGIAAGIVLISVVTRLELVVLVLLGIGMISITNDTVTATATRRLTPEAELPATGRLMLMAVVSGQIVAAVAVALLVRVWSITDVMLAIGIACALLMVALFVAADGVSSVTRRMARS